MAAAQRTATARALRAALSAGFRALAPAHLLNGNTRNDTSGNANANANGHANGNGMGMGKGKGKGRGGGVASPPWTAAAVRADAMARPVLWSVVAGGVGALGLGLSSPWRLERLKVALDRSHARRAAARERELAAAAAAGRGAKGRGGRITLVDKRAQVS